MMDKNREAFEAWFNDPEKVDIREAYAWKVWQASRQEIEVNFPPRRHSQGETTAGNDYMAMGFNLALTQCADSINALGIRVKGEGQ